MRDVHGIQVAGGTFPAQIWHTFMTAALAGKPAQEFADPGAPPFQRWCGRYQFARTFADARPANRCPPKPKKKPKPKSQTGTVPTISAPDDDGDADPDRAASDRAAADDFPDAHDRPDHDRTAAGPEDGAGREEGGRQDRNRRPGRGRGRQRHRPGAGKYYKAMNADDPSEIDPGRDGGRRRRCRRRHRVRPAEAAAGPVISADHGEATGQSVDLAGPGRVLAGMAGRRRLDRGLRLRPGADLGRGRARRRGRLRGPGARDLREPPARCSSRPGRRSSTWSSSASS